MTYVSVGVRFEANVSALNMAESVGNFSRHRRVPYLLYDPMSREFRKIEVPAISGEMIAHAFQRLLVREALALYGDSAPVCEDCKSGEFVKSMDEKHMAPKIADLSKEEKKDPAKIEAAVLRACLVEDIGGFLYAKKDLPVRRTSRFQVSFAVPVKRAAIHSELYPQLLARHSQLKEGKETRKKKKEEAVERGEKLVSEQMLFYVDAATALYGFTFNLDLDAIAVSSITGELALDEEEAERRRVVAMRALFRLLSSRQFGAKLSRFFPVGDIVFVEVARTEYPFAVTSPVYWDAAAATARRLDVVRRTFNENVKLAVFDALEDQTESLARYDFVELVEAPEEAVAAVLF